MKALVVAVLVVLVALGGLLSRRASAGERTELWMVYARADAPADGTPERSFVGTMASGAVCAGIADAVGRFMAQDQRRGTAVFACEAPIVVEAN